MASVQESVLLDRVDNDVKNIIVGEIMSSDGGKTFLYTLPEVVDADVTVHQSFVENQRRRRKRSREVKIKQKQGKVELTPEQLKQREQRRIKQKERLKNPEVKERNKRNKIERNRLLSLLHEQMGIKSVRTSLLKQHLDNKKFMTNNNNPESNKTSF